jgi:cell division protein FtsL
MTKEIWASVEDFEDLYEVSNSGGVRSLGRVRLKFCGRSKEKVPRRFKPRTMKKKIGKNGYAGVGLRKMDGKQFWFKVSRLVAKAFLPNPQNKPEVHHKDGNKLNDSADNLQWITTEEHHELTTKLGQHASGDKNGNHHSRSVFTAKQRSEMARSRAKAYWENLSTEQKSKEIIRRWANISPERQLSMRRLASANNKKRTNKRNNSIRALRKIGWSVEKLMEIFQLSRVTIKRILPKQRKMENV